VLLPDTHAARLLRSGRVKGVDAGEPLFSVEAEGLIAAVGRVPRSSFNEAALNELAADLPRLTPFVVRHEEAVRALFNAGPAVVPAAFGAVYQEEAGVERFLADERERLTALLVAVARKQEWGVKVFAEGQAVRAAAERSSTTLGAIDEEARTARPGRAYLLQRKRQELLAEEIRAFVGEALEHIIDELVANSADAHLDEVPANQDGPTELVLKAAFLVEEDKVDAFKGSAVNLVDRTMGQGLVLEVSGPWPPYSFTGTRT